MPVHGLPCDSEAHTQSADGTSLSSGHTPGRRRSYFSPAQLSPRSALFAKDQTIETKMGTTKRAMEELENQTRKCAEIFFQPKGF